VSFTFSICSGQVLVSIEAEDFFLKSQSTSD
jgi:hypothetical protein